MGHFRKTVSNMYKAYKQMTRGVHWPLTPCATILAHIWIYGYMDIWIYKWHACPGSYTKCLENHPNCARASVWLCWVCLCVPFLNELPTLAGLSWPELSWAELDLAGLSWRSWAGWPELTELSWLHWAGWAELAGLRRLNWLNWAALQIEPLF